MREATQLPVFWNQAQMRTQAKYNNERPFRADKFEAFASFLPATANLTDLPRWPAGCDRCSTCAVVGASGSILAHKQGAFIDAHDVVIRPNWLRTAGYEAHVGRRTSVNLFFALENMVKQFETYQRTLPRADRAIGLATSASERSTSSYFRHLVRLRNERNGSRSGGPPQRDSHVYLLSDAIYLRALSHLCDATRGGCEWQRRSGTMRPSTGFIAAVVATQLCRHVSLFGLTSDPCRPFHYYGPSKAKCTNAVPTQNDEHVHWFEREHEIYAEWQRRGVVSLHS